MLELLAQAKPAGGAALDQVAIATGAAGFVTVVLLWLGMGHRSGKVALLGRLGPFSERVSGLPAWAAIPAGIIVVSLITALFGMLWDISLHIAQGRDEGPLANPRTTSSSPGCSASSRRASSRCACRWRSRRGWRCGSPTTGTRRSAAC